MSEESVAARPPAHTLLEKVLQCQVRHASCSRKRSRLSPRLILTFGDLRRPPSKDARRGKHPNPPGARYTPACDGRATRRSHLLLLKPAYASLRFLFTT